MSSKSSSDAEIFFASVTGMVAALLAGELLFRWLAAAGAGALGPSLLARTAALSGVRPLYAIFVLLPAGLTFLAIGLPFFLRLIIAAVRGQLARTTLTPLLALGVCMVGAAVELRMNLDGTIAVAAALLVAAYPARLPLARIGERYAHVLLVVAGLSLAALTWYESRTAIGSEASIALAPTALVAVAFFAALGLVTASVAAAVSSGEGRISAVLCWVTALVWTAMPVMRSRLVETAAAADSLELASTAAAAVVLLVIGAIRRFRG